MSTFLALVGLFIVAYIAGMWVGFRMGYDEAYGRFKKLSNTKGSNGPTVRPRT